MKHTTDTAPCTECGGDMSRGGDDLWSCADCDHTADDGTIKDEAREREADNRAWQREMAMEAGMLHGVDAYNEMMGYDVGPEDDFYR
jgi:hypothetical protein